MFIIVLLVSDFFLVLDETPQNDRSNRLQSHWVKKKISEKLLYALLITEISGLFQKSHKKTRKEVVQSSLRTLISWPKKALCSWF